MPTASAQPHLAPPPSELIGVPRTAWTDAPKMANAHILVVDDEPDISALVAYHLARESYRVRTAASGPEAIRAAELERPDLVVLDLMLPGLDGYRVLQGLRQGGSAAPVLILTARGDEADKVRGLRLGADDYVTKPFGLLELLARVEALLRRAAPAPAAAGDAPAPIRFGEVEIDLATRSVRLRGEEVALAPRELDLLLALIRRGGRIATRVELMREVWGHRAAIVSRTVDTHVAELRRKLEADPAAPRHILTVRKSGYRFQG